MKNEFVLSIEESLISLKEHGILVLTNSKNQKLFCKPISHENGFIELKILSMKELGELGITVQESCINSDFDIEVQESEFTNDEVQKRFEEERRKKSQQIPLNSVTDALKMKEIAEKAQEILARKDASPEDLKAENEDLRAKLELIASKELERRMEMWKIDPETRKAIRENPERLKGYELARQENNPDFGSAPSGSAPLNAFQRGVDAQIGFENMKEMIDHLRKNPSAKNEAILKKLFEKMVQGLKERGSTELPFEIANPKDRERDSNVKAVEVNILAPKDPNQESELEKFGVGKRKRRVDD